MTIEKQESDPLDLDFPLEELVEGLPQIKKPRNPPTPSFLEMFNMSLLSAPLTKPQMITLNLRRKHKHLGDCIADIKNRLSRLESNQRLLYKFLKPQIIEGARREFKEYTAKQQLKEWSETQPEIILKLLRDL